MSRRYVKRSAFLYIEENYKRINEYKRDNSSRREKERDREHKKDKKEKKRKREDSRSRREEDHKRSHTSKDSSKDYRKESSQNESRKAFSHSKELSNLKNKLTSTEKSSPQRESERGGRVAWNHSSDALNREGGKKGKEEKEEDARVEVVMDEEKKIELARARRKAIMEKYKNEKPQETPSLPETKAQTSFEPHKQTAPVDVKDTEEKKEMEAKREPKKEEKEVDMFDMFAENLQNPADNVSVPTIVTSKQTDVITDKEGYVSVSIGQILAGRYKVLGDAGKGVFSCVVRAHDLTNNQTVIVKIARYNEYMKRVGKQEVKSLELLSQSDPNDQFHCVRMLDNFEERGLLCIVMEAMASNLRKVLNKFGKGVGISLKAVQLYSKQLLISLYHLKSNALIHTDFKLDNILLDDSQQKVKLSDFGSVVEKVQAKVTNELCPLWYRPPEIFLGMEYSYPVDMWCFGCTIFELATGDVLFQGGTPNEQMKLYHEVLGPVPRKLLKKAAFVSSFFDSSFNFLEEHFDKVTQKTFHSIMGSVKATRNLKRELFNSFNPKNAYNKKQVSDLGDLILSCLTWDPKKRISVEDALKHTFVNPPPPSKNTQEANKASDASLQSSTQAVHETPKTEHN